jgi:hypothetical protein
VGEFGRVDLGSARFEPIASARAISAASPSSAATRSSGYRSRARTGPSPACRSMRGSLPRASPPAAAST